MTNLEAMKKVIELIMENQESVKKMIELITMNPKAMKKVIKLMDKDGTFKEVTEIAREHEIELTEVWSNGELIGIAVEDEVLYFN